MTEKIMTLHPEGKEGVNIDKVKYDAMRAAIIESLREQGAMSFQDLNAAVGVRLRGHFDGSVSWYFTTIKLDLEARGEIETVRGKSPQMIQLKSG